MLPQQEKRLDLQLVPTNKGACTCQAQVTFSTTSSVRLQVQEPKILIKAQAPENMSAAVRVSAKTPRHITVASRARRIRPITQLS